MRVGRFVVFQHRTREKKHLVATSPQGPSSTRCSTSEGVGLAGSPQAASLRLHPPSGDKFISQQGLIHQSNQHTHNLGNQSHQQADSCHQSTHTLGKNAPGDHLEIHSFLVPF